LSHTPLLYITPQPLSQTIFTTGLCVVQLVTTTVELTFKNKLKYLWNHQDTGLFGIQATSSAQDAPKTVELLARELKSLRSGVTAEELERAKNMTASSLFLNLETMGIVTEDLGRQTMCVFVWVGG